MISNIYGSQLKVMIGKKGLWRTASKFWALFVKEGQYHAVKHCQQLLYAKQYYHNGACRSNLADGITGSL